LKAVTFSAIIGFAQFNELEQLDPQSVTFHFPVEAISSPGFKEIIAQVY
jgi:hypothetical protein